MLTLTYVTIKLVKPLSFNLYYFILHLLSPKNILEKDLSFIKISVAGGLVVLIMCEKLYDWTCNTVIALSLNPWHSGIDYNITSSLIVGAFSWPTSFMPKINIFISFRRWKWNIKWTGHFSRRTGLRIQNTKIELNKVTTVKKLFVCSASSLLNNKL